MDFTSKIFGLPFLPKIITLLAIFAIPAYLLYRLLLLPAPIALVTTPTDNCQVTIQNVTPSSSCHLANNAPGFYEFRYICSDGHQGELAADTCLSLTEADAVIRADCLSACNLP